MFFEKFKNQFYILDQNTKLLFEKFNEILKNFKKLIKKFMLIHYVIIYRLLCLILDENSELKLKFFLQLSKIK